VADGVRALSASVLGMLADRSPTSWNDALATGVNYRATTSFSTLTNADGTGALDRL
jgi:hypothetical protein